MHDAAFTALTTPPVTSTFCYTNFPGYGQMQPGSWWTYYWQPSDCTHGLPPAGWVSIGQAQNTDNPIAAVADCQAAYGQVYNNPDFTGATGTSLNCLYVAPPSQPQPTPGITICAHTWNEFVVGAWAAHPWAVGDCSHGLPEVNDAWAGQSYFLPGLTDCSNGAPSYYNPYNWGNQTTMTVKCVYVRVASPATPRFTLCTTGTLRNPDGTINYHSGWYNPDGTFQYTWKGTDCTNGLPQQGASAIGIAVGSATNGGGGLQGGNCLPGGAQHYNDPDWAGYSTGQMRCLFENNATSPYLTSNPCGIGTFPQSVELSADGGRWYFLMNAFAGCGWTAVATVDWLVADQAAGTGAGVLTFGVATNTTISSRTGGIHVCGTDPLLCGLFVVVQTPYFDGQPFCGGYCPGPGDTPPPAATPPPVGTIVYYHTDAIGSVRMVTDDNQQVVARYDYWPFGEQAPAGAPTDPRMFAGAERDSSTNTNLDYLGARYYAGLFGRFTAVDPGHAGGNPTNPQSWNGYTFGLNNPLRFVDPTGTCSQDADGNYFDSDDEGATFVAGGPCAKTNGALNVGANAEVTVKPKSIATSSSSFFGSLFDSVQQAQIKGFGEGVKETVSTLFSSSWESSCLTVFATETTASLMPIDFSYSGLAQPAANFAGGLAWNRALNYAASRANYLGGQGLLYPLRSGVFRSMVERSASIVSRYGFWTGIDIAIADGLAKETKALTSGQCR